MLTSKCAAYLAPPADKLKEKLERVLERKESAGYLSMDLFYERNGLYTQLIVLVESELGERSKAIRSAL